MKNSMRLSLLAILAASLFLLPVSLFAESERSVQVGLAFGVMANRGIEELNSRLESQGYPAFETGYGTMGGLVRLRFDRLVFTAEGHAYRSKPESRGTQELTLSGGYAFLGAGYDLFRAGGFRLFPLLGIGGGSTRLHIYETQDVSFDGMLASPGRETSVYYGSMIVNASLAVEYYARITEKTGLVAGFQAGYNQSIYDRGWFFEGEGGRREMPEASGGPEVKFSGFAASLNIGWLFEF